MNKKSLILITESDGNKVYSTSLKAVAKAYGYSYDKLKWYLTRKKLVYKDDKRTIERIHSLRK